MKSHIKKIYKVIAGILLSLLMLTYIFYRVDIHKITIMEFYPDWYLLSVAIFFLFTIYFIYSIRWKFILSDEVNLNISIISVVYAFGLNAILPLRSGDFLKLLYLKRKIGLPLTQSLTRLFLEKMLDLLAVISLTVVVMLSFVQLDIVILLIPICVLAIFIVMLALIKYRPQWINNIISLPAIKIHQLYNITLVIKHSVAEFSSFLSWRMILTSFSITCLIWFLLEYLFFNCAVSSIGIDLDYMSTLIVIIFAVLSVAIPSAPSGIGVFHAAVMSAFELLGYSPEDGLIAATILHLLITLPVLLVALIIFLSSSFHNYRKSLFPFTSENYND